MSEVLRPRVLFVGRTRYTLPLGESIARKWDALANELDLRVVASAVPGGSAASDPRFVLVPARPLDGPRFYAGLPMRLARELRLFKPDVVIAESPYEGVAAELARRLTRSQAKLIVEVHGDWRVSTRLYGSPARRLLGPLGDRLARFAVRSADGTRAVGAVMADVIRGAGREPSAVFTTFSDLGAFTGQTVPVPEAPRALFVGVLERYKNVSGLAAAWRLVSERLPEATLHLVGNGTDTDVAEGLMREGVQWDRRLTAAEVATALDEARVLLLPSASEGLPRVAMEAFLRGRAVIGSAAGGIPDIIEHNVNGLLVPYGDVEALADAIVAVLSDHDLAVSLGQGALASSSQWNRTPAEYARKVRELVDGVLAGR
ncbi:MAG: glycosyltransferase [Actinobacteria bacterium]|uniref:Unannotated protein n=1 Tax=freshwater metagenome TaxID=449393 RepID=A0A6J6QJG2_9ZZZZ|nr:glycosyltransferase [Actinomycetota bacterium]